ncbi:ThiJ/PfpI domain-containing protein [Halovivax asiaticus JCM 14624]|uniref:ThiJ/PfpI domain-containing protein n=1 Tax=Halovivax asiaticus JCM 14624 TaxID=1227490 RepID=M0BIJ5_9EURY|nr:DJ-1/PfpI family protein [Halovivax asiaticus]ELZ10113.1 ThiJ/PfpI domain-containing protein [Halovivax asiaticus JCM 14624]
MATFDVEIVLFDGFDELDAVGPYEVFDTARVFGADLTVSLVTLDTPSRVTASHGLRVEPDGSLSTDAAPDLLVVPGGGWTSDDGGVRRVVDEGRLPAVAAELAAAGTTVASVCTGAMILAEAGLVDGRPATTHEAAIDDLATVASEVHTDSAVRAVDDGDVLTAGGVTAGIDLALWLVERESGADVAAAVATELEHERRGTIVR